MITNLFFRNRKLKISTQLYSSFDTASSFLRVNGCSSGALDGRFRMKNPHYKFKLK